MNKRKIWISALLIILSVLMIFSCSCGSEKQKLSEMEDDELIQYISDSGVEIPEWADIVTIRSMIVDLENDPSSPTSAVGYTPYADLFEDLRGVVVEYEAQKN